MKLKHMLVWMILRVPIRLGKIKESWNDKVLNRYRSGM